MYEAGPTPTALRQLCAVAYAGMRPQDASAIVYEPFAVEKILTYVDPNDHANSALAAAGMYDFGNQAVRVLEIRALAALGNISAVITDRKDVQTMDLTVGGTTPAIDLSALGVVPGDKVIVVVDAAGTSEEYTVKEVVSATRLITEEIATTYALIAPDTFTISRGTTILYTHTLGGVDTLDIDPITTHNVSVGTPAANRLYFSTWPLVVLPSQVLLVSTAVGNAAGWLDVYVVKTNILY